MPDDHYDKSKWRVNQQHMLTGNDAATLLFTPQAGTSAATKTHTTTCEIWAPGRAITLKKLNYAVKTAQTGTGCNLTLNVYNGTTSVGTLAITSTAANGIAVQSADMDSDVAATGYVRIIGLSTTTASDANSAIGQIGVTYQETYS
jgi:hypothetical protein